MTINNFPKNTFAQIKTKQTRQKLHVSEFLVKSKKTLGLSHFKIMCIVINMYFDLQIKRCSNPLLVLDIIAFRANIVINRLEYNLTEYH